MMHRPLALVCAALLPTVAVACDDGGTMSEPEGFTSGVQLSVHVAQTGAGDALWDLSVVDASEPPQTLWTTRTPSSQYGDMQGSVSYLGPCDVGAGGEGQTNRASVSLVGLYPAPVPISDAGSAGDPAPGGTLEIWPLPPLTRDFPCVDNQDVWVGLEATVATVDRAGDGVTARFGGVGCEAAWTCATDGPGGELTLSCAADGEVAPALLFEDPVLRCAGADDVTLTGAAGTGVTAATADGEARATWRFVAGLSADDLTASCTVVARATAISPDPQPYFGTPIDGTIAAGAVYPVVAWSVSVSDTAGPSCEAASLAVEGPVAITYTGTGDLTPLTFPNVSGETSDATE